MPTPNLGLSDSNALGTPVSATEANRINRIVDTQPFGALGAIGCGIIENADGTSLRASAGEGLEVVVNAGDALVLAPTRLGRAPHPVWGVLPETASVQVAPSATQFLCVQLVLGERRGDPDAEEGTASLLAQSLTTDAQPGTLLIATVVTSETGIVSVSPAGIYTKADSALKQLLGLLADLGYDESERGHGTVAARLDALEGRGTDPDTPSAPTSNTVTPAQFLALQNALKKLRGDFETFQQNAGNDAVVGVSETPLTLLVNMGKVIGNIVNLDPTSARQFLAGIDIPDATGDGQLWNGLAAPVVRIGGSAIYDEEEGTIHG